MKYLFITLCVFSSITFAESAPEVEKGFYLKQIDYRQRSKVSVSIPGFARIRFRPSFEYRYKVKKKVISVNSKTSPKVPSK